MTTDSRPNGCSFSKDHARDRSFIAILCSLTHLDPLAPVDERVAPVRVDPGDGEVGVGLGEHVLLVKVGTGQLELRRETPLLVWE